MFSYVHALQVTLIRAISFRDIFIEEIFMKSVERLVCSSSVRLPCHEVVKVQAWSENMQEVKGNCLANGYVFFLRRGACRP